MKASLLLVVSFLAAVATDATQVGREDSIRGSSPDDEEIHFQNEIDQALSIDEVPPDDSVRQSPNAEHHRQTRRSWDYATVLGHVFRRIVGGASRSTEQMASSITDFVESRRYTLSSAPAALLDNPLTPQWKVTKFPDGENEANKEFGQNQYAWAASFNRECGYGFVAHSGGVPSLSGGGATFPTLTFRDASTNFVLKKSFPKRVIGFRSGVVTGCPGNTLEIVVASVGNAEVGAITVGVRSYDPVLYKVTVQLDNESAPLKVEELVPNLDTAVGATSIRSLFHAYDGNDCHLAFAPLTEEAFPEGQFPTVWVADICANDVPSTLTKATFALGANATSLINHRVWEFDCDRADGICWYNFVTFEPDDTKVTGLDLVPGLFFGFTSDLPAPSSNDAFVVVAPVDTGSFLDSSLLSVEPLGQNTVMACTLGGIIYQLIYGPSNLLNINLLEKDALANSFEVGQGQSCYVCSSDTKDCNEAKIPGLVDTTVYVWQTKLCGDYIFIGTLDGTNLLGVLTGALGIFAGIFGRPLSLLGLADTIESEFVEIATSVALTLILGSIVTPNDLGFDLWFVPVNKIGTPAGVFRPVTTSAFRGLDYDVDSCESESMAKYDASFLYEDGVRSLICHSQPDGSDPKIVIGGTQFTAGQFSNTYVVDLSDECES